MWKKWKKNWTKPLYFRRVRGTAAGLSAALNYLLGFISTKSYLDLESSLSLPGISLVNCIIAASGLILMYKILPETENRSLEDIELHFSDNAKKITNRKITKMASNYNGTVNGDKVRNSCNRIHYSIISQWNWNQCTNLPLPKVNWWTMEKLRSGRINILLLIF